MSASAIVFIHEKRGWFLPYALQQAVQVEKHAPVVLMGDRKPSKDIHFHSIEAFKKDAAALRFEARYQHMSTHTRQFELFCWLRWFYLLAFMRRENLATVFYHDSDVMLQEDSAFLAGHYGSKLDYCACLRSSSKGHCSGGSSYWTLSALEEFCEYAIWSFTDREPLERYRRQWEQFQQERRTGGVCDMTMFSYFRDDHAQKVANLAEVHAGCVFDYGMASAHNDEENEYVMQRGMKKIIVGEDDRFYFMKNKDGSPIRAMVLHFAGNKPKLRMGDYYRGSFFPEKPFCDMQMKLRAIYWPMKSSLAKLRCSMS